MTADPIAVRVEGGWSRRYREPGEDRVFTVRVIDHGNSLNIFELEIPASAHTERYLRTKKEKLGHKLRGV